MEDNKEELRKQDGDSTGNSSSKKVADGKKHGKDKKEKSLSEKTVGFFKVIRAEFNKIIWPSRHDLIKQTLVVIVVCLLVGVIIFGMDTVLSLLLGVMTDLVG